MRLLMLTLIFALSFVLAACSNPSQLEANTTPAAEATEATEAQTPAETDAITDEESETSASSSEEEALPHLTIVTSFLPMYVFAANIIEGVPGVTLANMATPDTGCLHDYRLMPADMILLEDADVFIINGADMEGFMGDIAERMSHLSIINASQGIELLADVYGHHHHDDHHDCDHDDHDHQHDEDCDHDDHHDCDDDDHDQHNDNVNPHVWLSIPLAIQQIENITEGLKVLDPEHANLYTQNSEAYITRLQALHDEVTAELANISQREIITFHNAFPYFAKAYDLEIVGVITREPGSEPTASEIAGIIDMVKDNNIKAIFAEPQYPVRIAEMIAAETDAKVYVLDPISSGETTADFYETIMRNNMNVLIEALTDSELN